MKRFLLFFLFLLAGILLFAKIIKVEGTRGMVIALALFTNWQGLVLLFLTFLIVLIGTLRWREILKKQGFKAPFSDLFQAYLMGFAIDYLLPMIVLGGEAVRAHILKEKYSFPWQKGIASGFIGRILELTSVLLLVFPGVIFFLLETGLPPKDLAIILFSFLFILGGGIAFFYFKNSKRESILKILKINHGEALEMEREVFDFFRSKKVFKPLYLSFLKAGLLFLRVWVLMFFLGEKMDVLSAWPAFSFAWIGTRIPVPADIGFHEAIQVFAFKALNLEADKGTALALIIRVVETIFSLLGLFFLFKFGLQFLDRILLNKIFKKNEE